MATYTGTKSFGKPSQMSSQARIGLQNLGRRLTGKPSIAQERAANTKKYFQPAPGYAKAGRALGITGFSPNKKDDARIKAYMKAHGIQSNYSK